jgi:AraC family transcriptional regulator, arabinose operon regulatory protein
LIPDHQLFHCRGHGPVPHLWFAFNVAHRLMPEQRVPILLRPTRTERALMCDLTSLFSQQTPEPNRDGIFHGSMALLHVVLSRPEIQWQSGAPAAVLQTIQYIEKHYASPLTVPRLARMADLGVEALARSFKKYQGDTIGQFIAKVRVREAAHMLTHTDATIDDIAARTGFPNRAYLSRVFKKTTGESPAQFRRQHA